MIAFPLLPKTCYNFSNWVGSSAQIMAGKVKIHVKPYAALINLTATLSRSLASITEPRKNSTLVKCLLNRPSRSRFGNRLQVIEFRDNYTPNSGSRKGNGYPVKCHGKWRRKYAMHSKEFNRLATSRKILRPAEEQFSSVATGNFHQEVIVFFNFLMNIIQYYINNVTLSHVETMSLSCFVTWLTFSIYFESNIHCQVLQKIED